MDIYALFKSKRISFSLACVAAVAIVFVSEASYQKSVKTLDELGMIGQARLSILRLERGLLDAETNQRGYLLTDRNEFLEPYEKASQKIEESLRFLDQYYEEEPIPKKLVQKLRQMARAKLSELGVTIRIHDEAKSATTAELVLNRIGIEPMKGLLELNTELLQHESLKVAKRRDDFYQTLFIGRISLASLCAITLVTLFVYLRQNSALLRQQREQQGLVQAERDRLEDEVTRRTAKLTELTHHLQTAREDERGRLARDLHDELGALLTSAKLDVTRIKARLTNGDTATRELLTHLVDMLNNCIALKRQIIEGLQPSSLSHLGLVTTLDILAREFTERSGINVQCELAQVRLEAVAELVMYRVVQEALTNITKYAHAHNVWITLEATDGDARLTVRDDGVGFDTATQPSSAHGLTGMRFRVESEGGSLAVEAAPGQGTQIRVTLPESSSGANPGK